MKKSEVYVDVAIAGELERAELEPQLQQSIKNKEIINSLAQNPSKLGGSGGGIPDAIFEFYANGAKWFGIIENKSGKNAMGKLTDRGFIDNFNKDGTIAYKNKVAKFALNGAYYYAKNCYRDTSYKNYLVIGVCGYEEFGEYKLDISCYVLNNETGGEAIYFDNFKDLSFLHPNNREGTMKKIAQVHLTEEQKDEIRIKSEMSVQSALSTLNEKMWTEYGIDAKWRINVFVSMVLSGLGGDGIEKLQVDDLRGSTEDGSTDADLILRKIKNLLDARGVPATKVRSILLEIERTIKSNTQFNTTGGKSETVLKMIYRQVVETIIHHAENRMLDFAGAVYNEVTRWMSLADDEANDVVLTPRYVIDLMVKLAQVDRNSYIWDFALGSGGFLISGMNEAVNDAVKNIKNESELSEKIKHIKEYQLLGIEKRGDIQMLAVLNMFLVGDGSSNILHGDSLTTFTDSINFPANVFLLNPPYSAEGNGMVFVKKALGMMKGGRACVIIQDSAGSGKASVINREILENNTLVASVKMPIDLFIGKSSVQASIYVFEVGKPHNPKHHVRFIDFRNDGYKRSNRKTKDKSINLRDVDNARGRYAELIDLVIHGSPYLNIFTHEDFVESPINIKSGADWNFEQHKKIDTRPTEADFRKTVADFMAWEVDQLLKTGWTPEDAPKGKPQPHSTPKF